MKESLFRRQLNDLNNKVHDKIDLLKNIVSEYEAIIANYESHMEMDSNYYDAIIYILQTLSDKDLEKLKSSCEEDKRLYTNTSFIEAMDTILSHIEDIKLGDVL